MARDNTFFIRALLSKVMYDVRKHTTVAERKAAYAYRYKGMDHTAEFHGPKGFYWHGSAESINHAKAKGWQAWLDLNDHTEEAAELEELERGYAQDR